MQNVSEPHMQIGKIAQRVGVNPKTIRYYEEVGILPPPARTASGYRLYTEDDATRLHFIQACKEFGFTLGEIKELLAVRSQSQLPCPYVLATVQTKLADLHERIRRLEQLSRELKSFIHDVEQLPHELSDQKSTYCHVIQHQRLREQGVTPKTKEPNS